VEPTESLISLSSLYAVLTQTPNAICPDGERTTTVATLRTALALIGIRSGKPISEIMHLVGSPREQPTPRNILQLLSQQGPTPQHVWNQLTSVLNELENKNSTFPLERIDLLMVQNAIQALCPDMTDEAVNRMAMAEIVIRNTLTFAEKDYEEDKEISSFIRWILQDYP
jgi:hypothetical protein